MNAKQRKVASRAAYIVAGLLALLIGSAIATDMDADVFNALLLWGGALVLLIAVGAFIAAGGD